MKQAIRRGEDPETVVLEFRAIAFENRRRAEEFRRSVPENESKEKRPRDTSEPHLPSVKKSKTEVASASTDTPRHDK